MKAKLDFEHFLLVLHMEFFVGKLSYNIFFTNCEVMFLSLNMDRLLLGAKRLWGCFTRPTNMLP